MKVYIGGYKNNYNVYNLFSNHLMKIGFSEEKADAVGDYLRKTFVQKIISWYNETFATERKVKIIIDPSDVWNMDSTLALIIVPMLKQLRNAGHGYPYIKDEDVPPCLWPKYPPPVEDLEKFREEIGPMRWNYILDEMIWSFEQYTFDWEEAYISVDLGNGTKGFDKEGHKKHFERMENGTRLFGRYYGNLWD